MSAVVHRSGSIVIAASLLLALAACSSRNEASTDTGRSAAASAEPSRLASASTEPVSPSSSSSGRPESSVEPVVVVLGDSLTAGLGLAIDEAYPALLQERLTAAGLRYKVRNAGISGDTSAGGLSRIDWALDGNVRILIVALGANDGLRGLSPDELKRNLAQIIERAQAHGVSVILAGMEAPPNWGREYTIAFHKVYPALAAQYHVPLVPFLLANVAGIAALNQRDGIHPTAEGDRIVADTVWKVLEPVAKQLASRSEGSTGS